MKRAKRAPAAGAKQMKPKLVWSRYFGEWTIRPPPGHRLVLTSYSHAYGGLWFVVEKVGR